LKRVNFFANGKFFRLADVATIRKGYADPPQPMFRFNGEPAIGLAISMAQGGNNLVLRRGRGAQDGADHRQASDWH
jgi:multidrug efflux pump subunit AcrB